MPLRIERRLTGVLVPVFALRGRHDLGIGDVGAVREMTDWCAERGIGVLQLLPIHETGDDHSPYNAISSIALDPTALDLSPEALPELTRRDRLRNLKKGEVEALTEGPVRYREVKALKQRLLRAAFDASTEEGKGKTAKSAAFEAFVKAESSWLGDYALFRALMGRNGCGALWESWPEVHRTPESARAWVAALPTKARAEFVREARFHAWVQWVAFRQWTAARGHARRRGVALMGDIPFGIGRCSADVWAERALFDLRWSCGAPPETFFKPDLFTEKWGQNWGVPLYRWDRMREDGGAWWRRRVAATARIFDLFRVDHVLGFYRVYAFPWPPQENGDYVHLDLEQAKAKAGDLPRFWPESDEREESRASNRLHGEAWLRTVLEAAGESGVVAEDLGFVPDYVRPSLASLAIPGFKIPLFERMTDGAWTPAESYPPLSVATFATHDHEPLAALWEKWACDPKGALEARRAADWAGWGKRDLPPTLASELQAAFCRKLLGSPSWLAAFMITDLLGLKQRFNAPGPMSESNWTERLPCAVRDLGKEADPAARLAAIGSLQR
ncbi:MAG: 4-alpha-glucanotransferase [Verrucomicrobiae bacterium]|nr:4-alpha-glucanotransferase [Verrucomicrobiae bacterium]